MLLLHRCIRPILELSTFVSPARVRGAGHTQRCLTDCRSPTGSMTDQRYRRRTKSFSETWRMEGSYSKSKPSPTIEVIAGKPTNKHRENTRPVNTRSILDIQRSLARVCKISSKQHSFQRHGTGAQAFAVLLNRCSGGTLPSWLHAGGESVTRYPGKGCGKHSCQASRRRWGFSGV